VTLYNSLDCTGNVVTTSSGFGCFNYHVSPTSLFFFSAGTTSTDELTLDFYPADDCLGETFVQVMTSATTCGQNIFTGDILGLSYRVNSI